MYKYVIGFLLIFLVISLGEFIEDNQSSVLDSPELETTVKIVIQAPTLRSESSPQQEGQLTPEDHSMPDQHLPSLQGADTDLLSIYYNDPEDYQYLLETCSQCGVILALLKASMQFGADTIILGPEGMFENFEGDDIAYVYNHILAIANVCTECAAGILYAGRYRLLPLTIDSIDEFVAGRYQSGYMDSVQAAQSDPEYSFFFTER